MSRGKTVMVYTQLCSGRNNDDAGNYKKEKIWDWYNTMNAALRKIDAYPCSCTHRVSSSHRP
jgi:hypothetical protein